jgi:hypothetical protein
MTKFWLKLLLLRLKKQYFEIFLICANYGLDPVPDLNPEPKLFQSRNLKRNKSLRFYTTPGESQLFKSKRNVKNSLHALVLT